MKYIETPNLPQKRVTHIFCSADINGKIYAALKNLGIIPIKIYGCKIFTENIRNHADMNAIHISGRKWILYDEAYENNKTEIDALKLDVIVIKGPKSGKYPHDISLNFLILNSYLIGKIKYAAIELSRLYSLGKVIATRQGYAKCSSAVVGETSYITADESLCKSCIGKGFKILKIPAGHIELKDCEYGFIGGCAGKIDKNRIIFSGDIKKHPAYSNIYNFCKEEGVTPLSLSEDILYDYGGFLPIIEE